MLRLQLKTHYSMTALSHFDDSASKRLFRELLEDFGKGMAAGFPHFYIPSVDPLSVDVDQSFGEDFLLLKMFKLNQVNIVGLSAMNITELNVDSNGAIVATVSISRASITGKYSLQVYDTPSSSADFHVKIHDVCATIRIQAPLHHLDVQNFKSAKIDSIQFQVCRSKSRFADCDKQSLGEPLEELLDTFDEQMVSVFQVHVSAVLQNELHKYIQGELRKAIGQGEVPSEAAPMNPFLRATRFTNFNGEMLRSEAITTYKQSGNIDGLVDSLLVLIDAKIAESGYDPYKLASSKKFSFKFLFFRVHAEFQGLTFYGLSKLKRTGPANLSVSAVRVSIGIDGGISGDTGVKVSAAGMKVDPRASIKLKKISFNLEMELVKNDNGTRRLYLKNLDAADTEVEVTIDGLGPLGKELGKFTGSLTTFVLDEFQNSVLTAIKDVINEVLKDFSAF